MRVLSPAQMVTRSNVIPNISRGFTKPSEYRVGRPRQPKRVYLRKQSIEPTQQIKQLKVVKAWSLTRKSFTTTSPRSCALLYLILDFINTCLII